MAEAFPPQSYEPFISPHDAAEFLSISRHHLLHLARHGEIPAYPLGRGKRRLWRFKKSELSLALKRLTPPNSSVTVRHGKSPATSSKKGK
jgi:excisionase family DNA binding protein